ncbi:mitochondrial nucleoid-associated protein 1 isoform 1-T2 [Thomomys bottae]
MEVCPYCKKPFKRLKSHLPHCKMIDLTIPAGQKVYQSKPAVVPSAKIVERPTKDLTKGKRKELETEDEKRNTKSKNNRLERKGTSFLLQDTDLGRASTPKVTQSHLTFRVLKYSKPKIAFRRKIKAQPDPSINPSPKRELAKDLPKSEEIQLSPAEMEASLPSGSREPSLSNQGRKDSSATSNDVQANPVHGNLDTIEPQRQGLLVKLLAVPTSDCHSPKNLNDGVQTMITSVLSKSDSRDRSYEPALSADVGNPDAQEKNPESLFLGLHPNLLGPVPVENQGIGLGRGVEVCRGQGNAKNSMLVTHVQERASMDRGCKNFTGSLATKEKQQDGDSLLNLFSPREATYNKFLCVSPSDHQTLASLSIKGLQGEKAQVCGHKRVPDVTLFLEEQGHPTPEPHPPCHPQALHSKCQQSSRSIQCHISQSSLISHVAVGRKPALSSTGLEWFPELYPGYVELGVLPRKPQYWSSVAQRPQLPSPLGGHLSQVLLLERSSAGVWSLEPPTGLTTSTFPLTRLLGALHKGWIRCNTTIKKSGVGGITMLFTGYFLLCCSWSFRHLKLQRWRK